MKSPSSKFHKKRGKLFMEGDSMIGAAMLSLPPFESIRELYIKTGGECFKWRFDTLTFNGRWKQIFRTLARYSGKPKTDSINAHGYHLSVIGKWR